MNSSVIETRLRQLSKGADLISMQAIMQFTGTSRDWVLSRMHEADKHPIGKGSGARWHIHDVAKALET
jgi:hypothetical protein